MSRILFTLIISIILICIFGCSSNGVNPAATKYDISQSPTANDENTTSRALLGQWIMRFELSELNSVVSPMRFADTHINVTTLIPPPHIQVNSYNPVTGVIDVDVTMSNPYAVDVYDVRLIIFTDDIGHRLLNHDNLTALYDIPEGQPINHFKAFAKDQPDRAFEGLTQHTENLLIFLPGGNPNVEFAIDASIGGNCEEPYEICNFDYGPLYYAEGSRSEAEVDVFDWQDDVDTVNLYCPEITGQPLVPFQDTGGNRWWAEFFNNAGAPVGNYLGYVIAGSSNSGSLALYQDIEILVEYTDNVPLVFKYEITPDPPVIHSGEMVTFDVSASYDPDGAIVGYEWDFEWDIFDFDVMETEPVVEHVYYSPDPSKPFTFFTVVRLWDNADPEECYLHGFTIEIEPD